MPVVHEDSAEHSAVYSPGLHVQPARKMSQDSGPQCCWTLCEVAICRFCWCEADEAYGGQLINPCSCSGSVKYVHRRCLQSWQQSLKLQGQYVRMNRCDICRDVYNAPPWTGNGGKCGSFSSNPSGWLSMCMRKVRDLLCEYTHTPAWIMAKQAYVFWLSLDALCLTASFCMKSHPQLSLLRLLQMLVKDAVGLAVFSGLVPALYMLLARINADQVAAIWWGLVSLSVFSWVWEQQPLMGRLLLRGVARVSAVAKSWALLLMRCPLRVIKAALTAVKAIVQALRL